MPTWAATEMKKFYEQKLGAEMFADQSNRKRWESIQDVPDEEIWEIRKTLKKNTTVTTHGKKNINGVKYYRIGKNAYVKAANLY